MAWKVVYGCAALLLTGCFDGNGALGLPCENNAQCPEDASCIDGVCGGPQASSGMSDSATQTESDTGAPPPVPTGCRDGVAPIENPRLVEHGPIVEAALSNPVAVRLGAFDGNTDGPPAIAVLYSPFNAVPQVVTYRHDGSAFPPVAAGAEVSTESLDLAAADFNLDGADDVVVVNTSSPSVDMLFGGSTPFASRASIAINNTTMTRQGFSVAAANLAGGPPAEVIIAYGSQANGLLIAEYDDEAASLMAVVATGGVSFSPWDLIAVDLFDNATPELVVAASDDSNSDQPNEVQIYDGGLSSPQRLADPALRNPYGVSAGDLDGDGLVDLVITAKNIDPNLGVEEKSDQPGSVGLCFQGAGGTFSGCNVFELDNVGVGNSRLVDLNCDGFFDLIIGTSGFVGNPGDGQILVLWGPFDPENEVPVPEVYELGGAVGKRIAVGDVDDDGYPEAVVPIYGTADTPPGFVYVLGAEETP